MIESSVRSHSIAVRSSQFRMLEILLIIEFFISMKAYFFWNISPLIHFLLYVLIVFVGYGFFLKRGFKLSRQSTFATLFYIIAFYWGQGLNIIGVFYVLPTVLIVAPLLFFLSKEEAEDLLKKISILFGAIVALGIVEYLLCLAAPIPPFSKLTYVGIAETEYEYNNFIFMVQQTAKEGEFWRFASVFTEPGHLAVISCFLLHGNKYNFKKWYNLVLLLGVLVSLSLAGYFLLVIGMLLMSTGKNSKRLFAVLFVLVAAGYLFGNYYNGGNNIIHEKILERLEFDEEKGIAGNQRVAADTELYFLAAVANGDIIKGYGAAFDDMVKSGVEGAGWMFFLLRKGVIGLIFISLFYIQMVFDAKNRKYALGLLIIYICAFLSQADVFNFAWSVLFVCSYKNVAKLE